MTYLKNKMRFVTTDTKVKRYISGKGFVFTDSVGNLYNSSKQMMPSVRNAFDVQSSKVDRMISREMEKGPQDLKGAIPAGVGDRVVKETKANVKTLVRQGKAIPNVEGILQETVKAIPVQDIAKKVTGSGAKMQKPLSELLSKKKPKLGKGVYLHGKQGAGVYLHGAGFNLA